MALVFTLLDRSPHMLKYRVTSAGAEGGNLDGLGAGTPDLITDSELLSPMAAIMGGTFANQAASRAMFLTGTLFDISITPRVATTNWLIDADVNGAHPRLTLTAGAADATGMTLTIVYQHSETR